jgi:hypothetical protein
MRTRWMGSTRSRSVSAPGMITLPQRAIADPDDLPDAETCAQTCFWTRTSNCLWAMGVVAMGLGLHFYYVREMLASLALFSLLFFSLGLVVLSVFLVCYAGNHAAIWAAPASRVVFALFQQQDRGGTEIARAPIVEKERLSNQRSEVQRQMHTGRKL